MTLWGPILFVLDVAPANKVFGAVACVVLIPCMLLWAVRPKFWSVVLAAAAALVWLFLGAVGAGIDV